MIQNEIIELARQAGVIDDEHNFEFSLYKYLEAFAKLVAAKERERFIEICNHQADLATDHLDKKLLFELRDAVRARGQA